MGAELTSCTSWRKLYGSSAAFFSSFFPCARCSAAVRKPNVPLALAAVLLPAALVVVAFPFPFDFVFFGASSRSRVSSSKSSSFSEAVEREETEERREENFIDFVEDASSSESSGTMKSSSSEDALELVFAGKKYVGEGRVISLYNSDLSSLEISWNGWVAARIISGFGCPPHRLRLRLSLLKCVDAWYCLEDN